MMHAGYCIFKKTTIKNIKKLWKLFSGVLYYYQLRTLLIVEDERRRVGIEHGSTRTTKVGENRSAA